MESQMARTSMAGGRKERASWAGGLGSLKVEWDVHTERPNKARDSRERGPANPGSIPGTRRVPMTDS